MKHYYMILKRLALCCIFITFGYNLYSQNKNNFVRDVVLREKLRKYLIKHVDIFTKDSLGNYIPFDDEFLNEKYGNIVIVARNLKTDSVLLDKNILGLYAFRFADMSSKPHLYFKYDKKIEFIDLDSDDFDLNKLLKKIIRFFNKYPDKFTLQEKVKTIQGVMETISNNKFVNSGPL